MHTFPALDVEYIGTAVCVCANIVVFEAFFPLMGFVNRYDAAVGLEVPVG